MKKWETIKEVNIQTSNFTLKKLIDVLLENRGIKTEKERNAFLYPNLKEITPKNVGIDTQQLKKALARIQKAIANKEQIVVFGDYDVDGITGSAILWETLYAMGAKVIPYIPHRIDEGYGLSVKALENKELRAKKPQLIITVDNGIVAHEAVAFANEEGIDVIITDHHAVAEKQPDAHAIVHTTKLCGAGVAFLLTKEISKFQTPNSKEEKFEDKHLELATLGTVADMVPLVGSNRAIVKHGLEKVRLSKRPGLQALYHESGLNKEVFSPYDIGFVIAPRLNASGRIANAMDSLRLLCTKRKDRAEELAAKLEVTNKERQLLLKEATEHAVQGVRVQGLGVRKILVVAHESYAPGVIGLVAGKLVEAFYRPAIVLSIGETHSKASVRSVSGFNIIEFLRSQSSLFVNVGGHPMAAGFTIETTKLTLLQQTLEEEAEKALTEELLQQKLTIDCELPFAAITQELYQEVQRLAPFGIGNPEPMFATKGVTITNIRVMGKGNKHLKVTVKQGKKEFDAVAFGMGMLAGDVHVGDTIDIAYVIDENTWNGRTNLQLKVKDIFYK